MTTKTANDLERKTKSQTTSFKEFIQTFISEGGEDFLRGLKDEALQKNKDYQTLKTSLERKRVEVLTPVVNRFWAHKLAIGFGQKWKMDASKLENLIINDKGVIMRNGKPYAITSISSAASYMVYFFNEATKTIKQGKDIAHEIYIEVKGGLEWLPLEAVCERIANKRNVDASYIRRCYEQYANKE